MNNAGVMVFGEFEWQLDDQIRSQLEVNVLGTMSITRQLMPLLRRDSGRLVNVVSHCALEGLPGLGAYSASKAALLAWSDALRRELRKYGVEVVSFVPGELYSELRTYSSFSQRRFSLHVFRFSMLQKRTCVFYSTFFAFFSLFR